MSDERRDWSTNRRKAVISRVCFGEDRRTIPERRRFIRVNGVRVNYEKYHRKMRQLKRLDGTPVQATARGPKVVHAAVRFLIPPTGRQVYPRVGLKLKCGAEVVGLHETYAVPTCFRCRKALRRLP